MRVVPVVTAWTRPSATRTLIVASGATITHHHGVGADHAPYLAAEKGELGMAALEAVVRTFDPDGIMNPGVLLPTGPAADAAAPESLA